MSRAAQLLPYQSFEIALLPRHPQFVDLTDRRFGRLVVVGYAGRRGHNHRWAVSCDCGSRIYALGSNLSRGNTQSCGCLHSERTIASRTTHGLVHSAEYTAHQSMIARCRRPQNNNRHYERRICVCNRWVTGEGDRTGFECFYQDMGARPSEHHSVDRIDNDGNYEPGNCRWATRRQQNSNTTRNRFVVYHGERITLADAVRLSGVSRASLTNRLDRGWSVGAAIETPARRW